MIWNEGQSEKYRTIRFKGGGLMKKVLKKSSKKSVKKTSKKTLKKVSKKPLKKATKKIKKIAKKVVKKPVVKPSRKPSKKVSIKPVAVTLSAIKSTKTPLWVPSEDQVKKANVTRFIEFVNRKHRKQFKTFDDLYQWS